MTPEQREKKNQGDRDRRARQKALLAEAAVRLGVSKRFAPAEPPRLNPGTSQIHGPEDDAPAREPSDVEPRPYRKPRGGARPGSGPKPSGQAHMQVSSWKGTPAQINEFKNAGGGEWLRGVLQRRINKGEK